MRYCGEGYAVKCGTAGQGVNLESEWHAKFTETQIFRELSIEIERSLIQLKGSVNQLKSSLIQLESSLIQLESSLIQFESSLDMYN